MAVLFLFIDGVGLGKDHPDNPFVVNRYEGFLSMSAGNPFLRSAPVISQPEHLFRGVDATLGVDGLPQSGTGQATLFTGANGAKEVGRHFGPFPHSAVKPFLEERSLFHEAIRRGKRCLFMNAYPDIFFERSQEKGRWSCTTLMTRSAGIPLHSERDLKQGRAITAEITQQAWRDSLGIDVPSITPEQAAERMVRAAAEYDVLLYEYYLSDKAGHSQEQDKAEDVLRRFDRFLAYLIAHRRPNDTLVLCSDHGNIEDLSIKTHTYNPVPLFVKGPGAGRFAEVDSIQGVTPAMLDIL